MNNNIHIDINMNIDIHIIINMNRQYWYPQAPLTASRRTCFVFCHALSKKNTCVGHKLTILVKKIVNICPLRCPELLILCVEKNQLTTEEQDQLPSLCIYI